MLGDITQPKGFVDDGRRDLNGDRVVVCGAQQGALGSGVEHITPNVGVEQDLWDPSSGLIGLALHSSEVPSCRELARLASCRELSLCGLWVAGSLQKEPGQRCLARRVVERICGLLELDSIKQILDVSRDGVRRHHEGGVECVNVFAGDRAFRMAD